MKIVAEIGTSHCADIVKAKEMIFAACESGADIIKFQWVYADEILHSLTGFVNLPTGKIPLYDRFKELEVKADFFSECLEYTHKCKASFLCSPFGLKSLEELISIKPDMIKIASPELNHIPLLKKTCELAKDIPLVISSGVSKLSDIEKALNTLYEGSMKKENITLLHCSTFYPTPAEEYNVKVIKNLSAIFGIKCGISDHSRDPVLVPVLSTICGATMIEKHFTLSNDTEGLDDPVALNAENFSLMTHAVRQTEAVINRFKKEDTALNGGNLKDEDFLITEKAFNYTIKTLCNEYSEKTIKACLGDGIKKLAESEKENYGRTNRSLHYTQNLKKGQTVTEKDIAVLRTEKLLTPGLHPENYDTVIGAKLSKDVESGQGVQWKDFLTF